MVETVPHLAQLLDATFPDRAVLRVEPLPAQLSTRRYHRVQWSSDSPESAVAMQLPDEASRQQGRAFLDIQRFLASIDVPVPRIYGEAVDQGVILLEDLGDETFEARLRTLSPSGWQERYELAIDLLAHVHARAEATDPSATLALRRRYESTLLRSELDHFREWGLEAVHGTLSPADRSELDAHFDALTDRIAQLPTGFVHRDYQSRNLMCAGDEGLVVIDFQDAFVGPAAYDLVALLCDSYVELDAALQDAMLLRYAEQRDYTAAQLSQLVHGFRLLVVQRKLKDAGRFVFIDRVRQNPHFLPYYPGSLQYVARALRELPELAPLRRCLLRLAPGFPL
jgi:aminoglycoside/choline kinase family phosphotransferase